MRVVLCLIMSVFGSSAFADEPDSAHSLQLAVRHRKPIAAALAAQGRYLVVANRRTGTISLLDTTRNHVVGEFPASDRLSAFSSVGDGLRFAALDDKRNELILLRVAGTETTPRVEVVARTPVADDPAGVALSSDGRFAAVACRWSHRLQLIAITSADDRLSPPSPRLSWPEPKPRLIADVRLPFAARDALFVDDERRLVVADAFGGELAVVDLNGDYRITWFRLEGQSIRGLSYDTERREIVFAYQHLDETLPTTPEAIGQGRLLANRLCRTGLRDLDDLGSTEPSASNAVRPWPGRDRRLDRPGEAAADPQDLVVASDGTVYLALGGSNQFAELAATVSLNVGPQRRFPTGLRPSSVVHDPTSRRAFVVNQLSDSVTVVGLFGADVTNVSLGPSPELYPRDRGERLFFDARLSPGGFLSCHSCHVDGHTSGKLADTLADGTYGTPKRILTLQGTSLTDLWAWNAEIRELREQVRRSLETTMHVPPMRAAAHDDVAAFLHTLPFPEPVLPKPRSFASGETPTPDSEADELLRLRGEGIFAERRCGQCHVGPLTYTSQPSFDVGLVDERGRAKFNPPSLRGVSQNARLFHDNRCESIESVFRDEQHQLETPLSEEDIAALARFLRSL
jgi:DNA-binding beta-propeller fold protein YncE/mono/diheme cytochrome c family protein